MADDFEIDETLPDVVKGFLRRGAKLESIRLSAQGRWTHEGLDFENPRIIELFSRSVGRTAGGTWVLVIGQYTYPIEVEDTGFFVESIQFGEPTRVMLSDGTTEELDPRTLSYADGGKLYCRVHNGAYRARFKRPAYYGIADYIVESGDGWAVELNGVRTAIATVTPRPDTPASGSSIADTDR